MTIERCTNVPEDFANRLISASTLDCVLLYADECCQGYAIQAMGATDFTNSRMSLTIASLSPCDDYRSLFPLLSVEKWGVLKESMRKVNEYPDTALYYNDKTIVCPLTMRTYAEFIDKVWGYTKYIYGNGFGPEGSILFAYFHGGIEYSVSPYARNHFLKESSCRNVIHLTHARQSAWTGGNMTSELMDDIIRAVSMLVVSTVKNVYFNPAGTDDVWGFEAFPFTEIFTYDIYRGLEMEDEAHRILENAWYKSHPYPIGGATYWFRKWFLPLYMTYGGARILNNYFEMLSRHFPRKFYLEWSYQREINLGEFVHFFSGAAGTDLSELAHDAFRWDMRFEQQLNKAVKDFPRIRYM